MDENEEVSPGSNLVAEATFEHERLSEASVDSIGLSAQQLADDVDLSSRWESFHMLVEGILSDLPDKHLDIVRHVFDTDFAIPASWTDLSTDIGRNLHKIAPGLLQTVVETTDSRFGADKRDQLYETVSIALRICANARRLEDQDNDKEWLLQCHGPLVDAFPAGVSISEEDKWALPALQSEILEEDGLDPLNLEVLSISTINVWKAFQCITPNAGFEGLYRQSGSATVLSAIRQNQSPRSNPKRPEFFSAVLTANHQVFSDSPYSLRRYSRLATSSLLRQLHSFNVDAPIFGVVLNKSQTSFDVNWYNTSHGFVELNSCLFPDPSDPSQATPLQFDLCDPTQCIKFCLILSNLSGYSTTTFGEHVTSGLLSLNPIEYKPWKWNPDLLLPQDGGRLHEESASDVEKIAKWQDDMKESAPADVASAESTVEQKDQNNAMVPTPFKKEKLGKALISPPSTPGQGGSA